MRLSGVVLLGMIMTWPAAAQVAPDQPSSPVGEDVDGGGPDEELGPDITVTGQRERGAVPGDIKPDIQLRPADIRSYGVSSIDELLTELGPQVRSDQGPGGAPVVLLNGRRISSFREIRDIPTEAIERVDILPEEAALGLGYRPDQRVVNIVLRRRFRAYTGELRGGGTTEGGRYTAQADANRLRINRDERFNLNLHYDGATPLYERDRDIIPTTPTRPYSIVGNVTPVAGADEIDPALSALAGQQMTVAGVPQWVSGRPALGDFLLPPNPSSVANYRTLAAATREFSANGTYSRTIFGDVTASLNGSFEATVSDSRLGLGSGSLNVPAGNPFSPFTTPVMVDRYFVEAGARQRQVDGNVGHLGATLGGDVGKWRWSFTANADRTFSRTLSDNALDLAAVQARIDAGDSSVNPFALLDPALLGDYRRDYARSVTTSADAEATASGPLLKLPGGNLVASFKSGFETDAFDARAIRGGLISDPSNLDRQTGSVQASVDVPLTSRRTGFLGAVGNLSVNANAALDHLSDFGDLKTTGYGARWSPIDAIRLIFSVTETEGAPSMAQLGNPTVVTPDTRVFDYVRGESVDITSVTGGNSALRAENRRVTKLGLTLKPLGSSDLTLTANYLKKRTLNPIANFPSPTAAIEAAFPDRIIRAASTDPDEPGQLLRIDSRPVNFAREDSEELRWGINFSKRIGPAPPPRPAGGYGAFRRRQQQEAAERAAADAATTAPTETPSQDRDQSAPATGQSQTGETRSPDSGPGERPGGGFGRGFGGRGFGGFGGRGGGGRGGRLQFAFYHTWHFEDRILIRPGVPIIDQLNGGATGNQGGQPRHELELQAGGTLAGYGIRLSGNWQSGSTVQGGTAAAPTDLRFAPLATFNLRLFTNFQPNMALAREHRWLIGTRVTLSITNLFDAKLKVTDATGATPINYQPDLLDPTGRTIRLSIRKLFF
ncbi:TonB-dependent receptor [Sphingomonas cannabina]|uniref:TonB-dependent receptor n=1 Tax=Sphingomonas cannabina TaxID=2899123 RepID=UPI001F384C7F|nr:TonB-dependent receptor [Sphingomonas cannabina]UIJ46769.1 TonB-dependent receptor [Sphingomonas cannabina]